MLAEKFGGRIPGKEEHKKFVLERIQSGDFLDKDVAAEILARIPDIEGGEISYCVEIMTIVALRLQEGFWLENCCSIICPQYYPPANQPAENLSLLGGFAFGLLVQEYVEDDEWVQKLFVHIQQYLSIVLQLNPQECKQLAGALSRVFTRLTAEKHDR